MHYPAADGFVCVCEDVKTLKLPPIEMLPLLLFLFKSPESLLHPPADGFVRVYRLSEDGKTLELLHKTSVGGVPGAMSEFKGRLVVGVDNLLRLYDLGESGVL